MKFIKIIFACTLIINMMGTSVYAHGGRTDSAGGHQDVNNVSGLGSYHYHHGKPAHLHTNGVCTYDNSSNITSEDKESGNSTLYWFIGFGAIAIIGGTYEKVQEFRRKKESDRLAEERRITAQRTKEAAVQLQEQRRLQIKGMKEVCITIRVDKDICTVTLKYKDVCKLIYEKDIYNNQEGGIVDGIVTGIKQLKQPCRIRVDLCKVDIAYIQGYNRIIKNDRIRKAVKEDGHQIEYVYS